MSKKHIGWVVAYALGFLTGPIVLGFVRGLLGRV